MIIQIICKRFFKRFLQMSLNFFETKPHLTVVLNVLNSTDSNKNRRCIFLLKFRYLFFLLTLQKNHLAYVRETERCYEV